MSKALDDFGKIFIKNVRDNTIEDFDRMMNGSMAGLTAEQVQRKIEGLNKEQLDTISWLIPQVVDQCLHNMLWMVEQEEDISLRFREQELRDESDGLSGELYTDDGWIKRFSAQRYEEI